MEQIAITTYEDTCLVEEKQLMYAYDRLDAERERIEQAVTDGLYDTVYASVVLLDDEGMRVAVRELVQKKKGLSPTVLVVVGIGGSSLGMQAIHQALYGRFYNEQQPDIKLYVADTIDADYLQDIVLLVEQELERGNAVLVTIISKSGSTTETVVNAQLFTYLIKKAYPETYQQYLVIISDEGSPLWEYAGLHNIDRLAIPAKVGGRYSVFSAAGLFPCALLGIDIDELCAGARAMRSQCLELVFMEEDPCSNPALLRASVIYESCWYQERPIHDMFLFSADLAGVGAWYRQLMGESIGKEPKPSARRSSDPVGIMPTVSMGTVDLHSVGQLYLGGPSARFTTFVSVAKNNNVITVPEIGENFSTPELHVQQKSVHAIMNAIEQGVQEAYYAQGCPFMVLTIPEKKPYYIGMLLQLYMMEIMYLGYLLEVNPFDQPHVELYKKEAREILQKLANE